MNILCTCIYIYIDACVCMGIYYYTYIYIYHISMPTCTYKCDLLAPPYRAEGAGKDMYNIGIARDKLLRKS